MITFLLILLIVINIIPAVVYFKKYKALQNEETPNYGPLIKKMKNSDKIILPLSFIIIIIVFILL